jgi:hypothetical protein
MDLKLFAETLADRANVTARYRAAPEPEVASALDPANPLSVRPFISTAPERRPSRTMRTSTQPRLSEEVERILSSAPGLSEPPVSPSPARSDVPPAPPDPARSSSVPPASSRDSGVHEDGGENGEAPPSTQAS